MNKNLLLKNINKQIDQYRKNNYDMTTFSNIRKTFDEYLHVHPKDTEIWLSYALCMYKLAEGSDYPEECLRKILEYDQDNLYAIMLLVYINAHDSYISDQLFKQLCNLKSNDNQILSMIEYEKIWYYKDVENYERVLTDSVQLYDKHVWNNVKLGYIYLEKGEIKIGQELILKGLKNVQLVYDDDTVYDELSIEEYFNETIKGIHLTDINYNSIIDSLDPNYLKPIMDLINRHLARNSSQE